MSEEAISAWISLMRPRPVARWEWRSGTYAQYLSCGHVDLGYVMWKRSCAPPWVAYCAVTDEESGPMMFEDARAWLAERVSVEGFEVEGFEVAELHSCEYCGGTNWHVTATLISCRGCGVIYGRVNDGWVLDLDTVPGRKYDLQGLDPHAL